MFRTFFLHLSPIFKYKISGNSMNPTFTDGQIVLVNRLSYMLTLPKIREIVALHDPRDHKILIKRITQTDGKRYFVQGDNKNSSTDSRIFGMIEQSDIIGKVITS